MNHSQETELLDQTAQVIDADLRQAYQRMLALIDDGMPPRKASETVLAEFSGQYADTMAAGLSEILGKAVGTAAVREMKVGGLSLSARLYAESQATSSVVAAIIANNGKGWDDARKLALAIYEGYEFKKGEALNISPTNDKLPKYLRNELLTDRGLRGDLARHFTKIHTANLKSPALKAGYMQYLDALEKGAGQNVLDRKLEIAFHERMRYFANRIAQTELHRAWTDKQAAELMADDEIEFVQIRLSATHPEMDICDLFAGQDKYGLGPGVYRKAEAPKPPFHPFCRCMCSPRLDLTGAKARAKPSAEREFLRKLSVRDGARVMGSQQKLVTVLNGQAAVDDVLNAGRDPMYRLAKLSHVNLSSPAAVLKPE